MKSFLILFAGFLAFALVGCGQVSLDDVSKEAPYEKVIGSEFIVIEPVWEIGVTATPGYEDRIDYVFLSPGVGFAGPEVVYRKQLNPGFRVEVTRVLEGSVLLSKRLVYVVKMSNESNSRAYEARISVTKPIDSNFGLDPAVYRYAD